MTRCPAMMSSIGALCGSQGLPFIHSYPRCVFLLSITPCHKSNSVLLLNEAKNCPKTRRKKSPRLFLFQSWLCYSSTEEFCLWLLRNLRSPSDTLTQHTFILTVVNTHPLKYPQTIHFSRPTLLLLQGETFPRRGKKHLVVISFFFFSPSFLAPFH